MKIVVLTLFPELMEQVFNYSMIKRARQNGIITVTCINIRDYSADKHQSVDDYPYGGGSGMVMTPQPIYDAHAAAMDMLEQPSTPRTIYCSPKGDVFNQGLAEELAREETLLFLCGHYEGVDQRVIDGLVTDEISIGDYVLTGGELPAAVIVDAVSRMVPGVLKDSRSYQEDSHYKGLLEYPHYTRPPVYRGLKVPEVLLSGHHERIEQWRRWQSLVETRKKRPDLIQKAWLTPQEREWLDEMDE